MSKLKYLSAFVLAATVYVSFTNIGIWTYSSLLFSFVFIPLVELLFTPDAKNLSKEEKKKASAAPYFNLVLYAVVIIQIFFVIYFLFVIQEKLTTFDLMGRIISMGILCGIFGINVGHELGHRSNRFEQFLGEILLLTSLETRFLPYHNSSHHHNVATPKDPAIARKGEIVFLFWFRSQLGSYFQAWKIERDQSLKKGNSPLSISNRMLIYTLAQIALLTVIYYFFNM